MNRQMKAMMALMRRAYAEERCRGALIILNHRLMPAGFKAWMGGCRRLAIKNLALGLVEHDRILHGREL